MTRTPAQAAYEAYKLDHAPAWEMLPVEAQQAWTEIANAVAFAILHCDRKDGALQQGDRVFKDRGDYQFEGNIAVIFAKRSGEVRAVVEDDRGMLMILRPDQLNAKP